MEEYEDMSHTNLLASGWTIKFEFYSSLLEEEHVTPLSLNDPDVAKKLDTSMNDMCFRNEITYRMSEYFQSGHIMKHECFRE